ncbi:hypothetical protein U9M48_011877 [Paspalum notatum var. saurae]|uniref:DUF295 domain-containing protein n=1 Tax=Paspalum notatum var. saurae TaxID=547442 RepID=A0AAQ3WHH9_PASNO
MRGGGGGREEAALDWASLHVDLTQLIASRVLATGGFLDYVRFRAVCSPWRAAAASPRGRSLLDPRFHPRRWMLFPEGFGQFPGHRAHGGGARFFDLSAAGAFVRAPLPELKNHCVLDSPDGLLLLQRDRDNAVRLLHPFTRDVAEFLDIDCLAHQLDELEFELTANPVHYISSWFHVRYLIQARKLCAAVNLEDGPIGQGTVASGKLYVVSEEDGLTRVWVIDTPQPVPQWEGRSLHLCQNSLLQRQLQRVQDCAVTSIGDHILFAAARSLCVSSSWLPSIGVNSVVCFHAGENYLAQYDLNSGTWSPASDGHLMLRPPPRPCALIHHIFTCCDRQFWPEDSCCEDHPDNFVCLKQKKVGFQPFVCDMR